MICLIVLGLVLIVGIFVYKESFGYNIVEYTIFTDKDIPSPVRFVMLSDLHDTDVTHDGNERLLASIKGLDPDLIILAGDMITSYRPPRDNPDTAFDFMEKLTGISDVYFGMGNHEQRYREEPENYPGRFEKVISRIENAGITVLSDSHTDIEDKKLRIYCFDVPINAYNRGVRYTLPDGIIEETLAECEKDMFNILIAHTPDYFDAYAAFGPDLVLSGHLHGGIVAFPGIGGLLSPQLRLFPKYDHGRFEKDGTCMIVSSGIGWHTVPVRLFNKAEIVSVTIKSNKENDRGEKDGNQR